MHATAPAGNPQALGDAAGLAGAALRQGSGSKPERRRKGWEGIMVGLPDNWPPATGRRTQVAQGADGHCAACVAPPGEPDAGPRRRPAGGLASGGRAGASESEAALLALPFIGAFPSKPNCAYRSGRCGCRERGASGLAGGDPLQDGRHLDHRP